MIGFSWPDDAIREIERLDHYNDTLEQHLKNIHDSPVFLYGGEVLFYNHVFDRWFITRYNQTCNGWQVWNDGWLLDLTNPFRVENGYESKDQALANFRY